MSVPSILKKGLDVYIISNEQPFPLAHPVAWNVVVVPFPFSAQGNSFLEVATPESMSLERWTIKVSKKNLSTVLGILVHRSTLHT